MLTSVRSLVAVGFLAVLASPAQARIDIFSGALDPGQVVDGSTSTASGHAVVSVDTTLFTITTDLSWAGLSGPADRSHLHNAAEGQATDFTFEHELLGLDDSASVRTLACGFDDGIYTKCAPMTGSVHDVLQLSADDGYGFADFNSLVAAFFSDGVYVDMHTGTFEAGEIRGQLMPVPEPSTAVLLAGGLLAAFSAFRARRPERSALIVGSAPV